MSNHHHENRAEQMNEKIHGLKISQHDKMFYQSNELNRPEGIHKHTAIDDNSIRLLAYQIYRKNGGAAVDNWLEAEKILKN